MQQDTKKSSSAKTFYGKDDEERKVLCTLCDEGRPKDVLAQIRKSGFDSTLLNKRFFVYEASPIPIHPTNHPFAVACIDKKYPVVRLMIEIGVDPDALCLGGYDPTSPREAFAEDSQLQELFDGGKCWWKVEYSDSKKQELQDELERNILKGEASEAVWLMMHGVRLASPSVLAAGDFGKQPRSFQEVVCRLGIPENRLQEFHSCMKKNCAAEEVVDILETLLETRGDEGREPVEKLLLSIELLGEDRLDELVNSSFGIPVKTSMLRHFIKAYDASEYKQFIVRTMAALFMDILCSCMEV